MIQQVLRWERQKRCSSRKRQGPMTKQWSYDFFQWNVFLGKRRWRQEKIREWSNLISFLCFSKMLFLGIYEEKKNQHIHFWRMVNRLGPHLFSHLVKGPKALEIDSLKNWTMDVGPWKKTISMVRFQWSMAIIRENRQLVSDEPVEFEK